MKHTMLMSVALGLSLAAPVSIPASAASGG